MMATMALRLPRTRATAEDPLATLHREHYRSLVRLAALLLDDIGRSEEVVQDAFVRLHSRFGGLRNVEAAPAYLRSAVLNGARSQLRHRQVRERHAAHDAAEVMPSAESAAITSGDHDRVMHALRRLPERQREALALRYYLDLSEAEMAAAMGISAGSVKTHLHRGLAALGGLLEEDDQ
jgi:RNA polymerase sigma-70 factor (sigma-E family)